GPIRRGEQQPAREAALEVARDAEAREDAPEGGRLEQDEHELERRVAATEVEAGHVPDPLEPAGEGGEEEQREQHRGKQQRRIREGVVERAPGHPTRHGKPPHDRAILVRRARPESVSATTAIPAAMPNPSASASPSQPVMIRLRTHSTRYETGLAVAASWNQLTFIRWRGMFAEEMNRKTKKSGNS